MNSSPITSWEGAAAYFTFADNPYVLGLILVLAVVVTVVVTGAMLIHEKHSFEKIRHKS